MNIIKAHSGHLKIRHITELNVKCDVNVMFKSTGMKNSLFNSKSQKDYAVICLISPFSSRALIQS